MRLKQILLPLLVLLLLITSGCSVETPPQTPTLPSTSDFRYSPAATTLYVIYGHSVNFAITPNQDDATYTYAWNCSDSGVTPTIVTDPVFSWAAPGYAATCTVTATVSKAGTQVSTQSWTVYVRQASTYTVTVTKFSVAVQGAEVEAIGTGYKGANDNYIGTTNSSGQAVLTVPYGTYTIRCKDNDTGITRGKVDTVDVGSDSFTFTL